MMTDSPNRQQPATWRARRFRTPVRGHPFAVAPRPAGLLAWDHGFQLRREPDNPADRLAIAVWVDVPSPWRVGYLDRSVAAWLAPVLDAGSEVAARFEGWTREPSGRWERPVVVIEMGVPSDVAAEAGPERRYRQHGDEMLWGRPPGSRRRPVSTGK